MKESRQIGLFGGTFDPIHYGHLNISLQIKDLCNLDQVFFIPAAVSPFKTDHPPEATGAQRIEMCELALDDEKDTQVLDIEIMRSGPSYMVETVQELIKRHPDAHFRLILAEDALPTLHKWKDAETLLRLAPPLIGSRNAQNGLDLAAHFSPEVVALIDAGRVETKPSPISSTEVREKLAQGEMELTKWVPEKVLNYIKYHKLYSDDLILGKRGRDSRPGCKADDDPDSIEESGEEDNAAGGDGSRGKNFPKANRRSI